MNLSRILAGLRGVPTIARRELAGFFDQATAYILIVAFLALGIFIEFRSLYASNIATLRPLFDLLPWLFAVLIPAATMRSLAEERRSGTLEWLLAHPFNEIETVLGKFLGNWIFALVALAGTLPMSIGVLMASEADPGIITAQYVGASLLAAQFVAIGLWASSMTRNQITSFMLAIAVSLVLVLIGLPFVQIGLTPMIGGAAARLSVIGHFENVARGVIDLRDVLYFLSTAALFLVLAIGMVSRERLSHGRADYRRLRVGAITIAALVVMLNLLGGYIRGRLDLTRGNLYTLAEGTREVLGNIDDIVTFKLFVSDELPPEVQLTLRDVEDLLADFRRAGGGQLVVEKIDPGDSDEGRTEASGMGIPELDFNVLRDDEFEVRRGYFGLAMQYADQREIIPIIDRTDDLELRMATAVVSMTTDARPRLRFASGFGAKQSFEMPALQQALGDRYSIGSVALDGDTVPALNPDSIDVLVVAGPTEPMSPLALERLAEYVDGGGAAMLLVEGTQIDPQSPMASPVTSGLETFLEERGMRYDGGIVYDLASAERVQMGRQGIFAVVRSYPLWPILFRGADHPVTRDLNNLSVGWASSLILTDSSRVTPLWTTTEAGGVQAPGSPIAPDMQAFPDESNLGVEVVAAAVDFALPAEEGEEGDGPEPAGRMIVVADVDFLDEQFVRSSRQNLLFAANSVDWLAQDEALISIRSKDRTPPPLALESDFAKNALKWGNLVGIPLFFCLAGALRVTGRRTRAERRWNEMDA